VKPSEFRKHQAAIADAVCDQRDALLATVRKIRLKAHCGDGSRTFDDCIRDLGWIDDECRRVLAPPSPAKRFDDEEKR
jgi:hypothetical protein